MIKVTVTNVEDTPQPGVRVHWLSNGLFIREDPRKGSHRYTLYQPGQAKKEDGKILQTGPKLRTLLKAAARGVK